MIPGQALQRAWFYSTNQDACLPARLPAWLLAAVGHGGYITTHPGSSGVIISGSPLVTLSVSQKELSVTPKAWPEKEQARSRREAEEEERKEEE